MYHEPYMLPSFAAEPLLMFETVADPPSPLCSHLFPEAETAISTTWS
jgi:hypothetical protein